MGSCAEWHFYAPKVAHFKSVGLVPGTAGFIRSLVQSLKMGDSFVVHSLSGNECFYTHECK